MENFSEALILLAKNYDPVFIGQYGSGPTILIGPENPTQCRFCNKTSAETTFRNESHAISRLLGNHQLVLRDECDKCNELFSKNLEDHLGKFTKPYRVIGQVKGKNGIPSYKTPKALSRIDFKKSAGFEIRQNIDDPITEVLEAEQRIKLHFILERHSPCAVYKALVKIALSIMPAEELKNFEHAKRWIQHKDHTIPLMRPLKLLFYVVPGPMPFPGVSVMLLRKNKKSEKQELPYCILIIAFGNLQYQIMVPAIFDNRNNGENVNFVIPRYPTAFLKDWPFGDPLPAIADLSSGELTTPQQFTLSMQYGDIGEATN